MVRVKTDAGWVQGVREDGVLTFLGIPYAAPITPERAFLAPQPAAPWSGVRAADRFGAVCPQVATYGPVGRAATSRLRAGSDFLTVNVRTPALEASAPVLFWIHGGGYAASSANEAALQTGAFAASGIVEVSVNYRLGALGFLALEEEQYPDNRGLLDIVAALRWLRANIAAFGGDPARVTLAGRSAGGFAVAALLGMPCARGLFSQALLQSVASTAVATREEARKLTRRMREKLAHRHEALPRVAWDVLLQAQKQICDESYTQHHFLRDGAASMLGVPFTPVIDGATLPAHPETLAAHGEIPPLPLMIGCTSAEYLTHSSAQPEMDDALAARLLDERVKALGWRGNEIVQRYRQALPGHSGRGIWRAVAGDLVFHNPASRFARLLGAHQPVYKYLYGDIEADEGGAAHGAELGHVWFRHGKTPPTLAPHQRIAHPDFAAALHQVWVSFLRHRPPSYAARPWLPYRAPDYAVLHLTPRHIAMTRDVFAERLALWQRES